MALDTLSRHDFARVSAFIADTAGIKMPDSKRSMLEGRLRRRVRATGLATLAAYCAHVFDGNHLTEEAVHLVNAVTTNKTDFFREPRHFDYLRDTVLPGFVAAGTRSIRAWSAACSTGAEPYTLAMMLDDCAATAGGPAFGILATDIDTDVLETARKGIYPAAMLGPAPAGCGSVMSWRRATRTARRFGSALPCAARSASPD